MGINAGIVVVRQITDEYKWFRAMKQIQNEFEGEDYFVILPHWQLIWKEAFTVETLEKLMLTEDMNFSTNGSRHVDWHWKTGGLLVFHKTEAYKNRLLLISRPKLEILKPKKFCFF